ncbi:arabinan endo-1,5-alpha-L-arabinosidase [Hymenobacter chitinivorans]|uniref:Arabinan endo-1,5-alpha-L-arabinosidase n=1 Tax=Hymenobacter chitinivorans DSM 11115 TaxID=1121954 RepID=A0A2M9BNT3_9BACT|nr:arabinan endo-1,5-alpha-L-arabinosidase [Hymenobacter chitinivorans]PJJ59607.1 arabinan endo-1,5-alpha-L-arabinosidase [Hymenobacter chitinivorans DSM 11115]
MFLNWRQGLLLLSCWLATRQTEAQTPTPALIPAHDPVMIRQNGTYYMFGTGPGIAVWSSRDRQHWTPEKPVFAQAPAWAVQAVPGFKNHIWAPDISLHDGVYSLFYSVSAFGKNTSCIGLATNKTLDPKSPDYRWVDHGRVVQSVPGRDMWNAIDPNLIRDEAGTPWLTFGSFWEGIKLVKLRPDLTAPAQPEQWRTLARRPRDPQLNDSLPGDGAIEAPFIFRKNGFYYLFTSFDYCCRGPQSTYRIVVGRAKSVTGPYVDQAGVALDQGGGTSVLSGDKNWFGLGHNSVYSFDNQDYLVFHGYDAADKGHSKLRVEKLTWNAAGWPLVQP